MKGTAVFTAGWFPEPALLVDKGTSVFTSGWFADLAVEDDDGVGPPARRKRRPPIDLLDDELELLAVLLAAEET